MIPAGRDRHASSTTSAFRTAGSAWRSATVPTIASADGEILISLNKEKHGSTATTKSCSASGCSEKFPDTVFFFEPANITNQILNFGLPAPIDVQVVGRDAEANYKIAQRAGRDESRAFPAPPTCMFTRWSTQPEMRAERGSRQGRATGLDATRRHAAAC